MADERKDSRDRTKPETPESPASTNEQRRFRSQHPLGGRRATDDARREVAEGETSGDAPMDPSDEEFIKNK
jgi:hypothetical protein